jgi:hypothetical protein
MGGALMSAESSASSVSQAGGLDRVRALQRVLYHSAKQDPERRFHALFDKVARSDVMRRAWNDVRANKGAPGIDGVSIDAVETTGALAFLKNSPPSCGPVDIGPNRCGGCTFPSRVGWDRPGRWAYPQSVTGW